jgi:hypothetical protein
VVEDVTEGLLLAALRRTVDGARKMVELQHGGRTPEVRPGVACRWCPERTACPPGQRFLEEGEAR